MTERLDAEVVIVGAGPVGLTLAYRLEEAGISSLVLEAESELSRDLRASTFHPPTLDMLGRYGIDAELIARGRISPSWQVRLHATGERAEFKLDVLAGETDHPYRLQCEQFHLVEILGERLQASPHAEIRLGTRLERFEQDEDGVTVHAVGPAGPITASGRFLIGADGARSLVRKGMNVDFAGMTYPETTLLITTDFPFEEHLEGLSNVNYCWSDDGTFTLLRLKNLWRATQNPDDGESLEEALRPENVERKLQRAVPSQHPYRTYDVRAYRVHMRIVDDYRRGRVLLAGDAAHINSPSGGMGMNGGVHDAFELSDHLRIVMRRSAPIEILDRYTRRRRPVAEMEIMGQADRNRARMEERDPDRRRELLAELQAIVADPVRSKEYMLRSSMIAGLRQSANVE